MKFIILAFVLLTANVFALDLSVNTDKDLENSANKSLSRSKDMSVDKTKTTTKSKDNTKEKSLLKSKNLTLDGKVKTIATIAALEKLNLGTFGYCKLLTEPKNVSDFDLSCKTKWGGYNSGLCDFISSAAQNYQPLSEVVDKEKEEELKGYAACGLYYSGLIAQALKTGKLNLEIKDPEIKDQIIFYLAILEDSNCILAGNTSTIMCNSLTINIDNSLKLTANNVEIFGGDYYLGYKLDLSKNKSINKSLRLSYNMSSAKNLSNKIVKTLKNENSEIIKMSKKASSSLGLGKFIPAE